MSERHLTRSKRTERLQIMINDEELQAIESWRFVNCVSTRAGAVRKLIQLGLIASKQGQPIPRDLPLNRPNALNSRV